MSNYRSEAESDARETVYQFIGTIVERLEEFGQASDDLHNDYPDGDSWHHECHVDKYYNLTEAAEVIDQLSEFEETDSGLWESQQPKEAIGTCAAFTYGNAVLCFWADLIREINGEGSVICNDFDSLISEADKAEDAEDTDYEGSSSDDLRDEKKAALEEFIHDHIYG